MSFLAFLCFAGFIALAYYGLKTAVILITRQPDFLRGLVEIVDRIGRRLTAWNLRKAEQWRRENPPKHFLIDHTFKAQTRAGFSVEYWMNLKCERVDVAESIKEEVYASSIQDVIAQSFHDEVFERHLKSRGYFFHLNYKLAHVADERKGPTIVGEVADENGQQVIREVQRERLKTEVSSLRPFRTKGCEVKLENFVPAVFSDELIEENYAMLTDEQKKEIEVDSRYEMAVEAIAVAALKKRLDFLGRRNKQKYETHLYTIETEKAGNIVRIRWTFKSNLPSGHELVGFRKTGGFYIDQWSEELNGTLVIHDYGDGEVSETLPEGEANFYTFFVRSPKHVDGSRGMSSPLRFQLTISSRDEAEAITAALSRSEKKLADPSRENMANAVKELNLAMEFQEALDSMEKTLIAQVRAKGLPKDEEEEKIEFIRDAVKLQRDKYQPI